MWNTVCAIVFLTDAHWNFDYWVIVRRENCGFFFFYYFNLGLFQASVESALSRLFCSYLEWWEKL